MRMDKPTTLGQLILDSMALFVDRNKASVMTKIYLTDDDEMVSARKKMEKRRQELIKQMGPKYLLHPSNFVQKKEQK